MSKILNLESFSEILATFWTETPSSHSFSTKKSRIKGNCSGGDVFCVNSLSQCLELYQWNSTDFTENKKVLDQLSSNLQESIYSQNETATEQAIREIYHWGKVRLQTRGQPNASERWLEMHKGNGILIEKLCDSVKLVDDGRDFRRFDGSDLIMNSGFTKVVSLASSKNAPLIIFDGRVGAALGNIAVMACNELGFTNIADNLFFPWGASQSSHVNRNPSNDQFKFPRLFGGAQSHKVHAQFMHISSLVVRKAAKQAGVDVREFEAALFMWGYSV